MVLKRRRPSKVKKRGRPPGPRPSSDDLEILWQGHIWMTWPQYSARSFDELVRWAALVHYAVAGKPQPAADRTALPNRLKRLHTAIAAAPKKFGFPKWIARLPTTGRRVKRKPKESGAARANISKAVRALTVEADRYAAELKSQTRPRED